MRTFLKNTLSRLRRTGGRSLAPIALGALALLGAALATSCNVNGVGIFYGLENEKKIVTTGTLSNKLTIGSMVHVNGYYYAATGTIYSTPDEDGTGIGATLRWTPLSPPISGAICTQLVNLDPTISGPSTVYAIFVTDSAPTVASISGTAQVYEGTPSNGSISWTLVPAFANMYAQKLIVENKQLFVDVSTIVNTDSVSTALEYSVWNYDPGTGTATQLSLGGQTNFVSPIIAGAYDYGYGGGTYWLATGSPVLQGGTWYQLFTSTNPAGSFSTGPALPVPSGLDGGQLQVSSLYYSPKSTSAVNLYGQPFSGLGALFVSTRNGYLYAWLDGGSWLGPASITGPSGQLVGLNGVIDTGTYLGTSDAIIVGSDIGYYEMDLTPPLTSASTFSFTSPNGTNDLTTDLNYTATALYNLSILNFLLDPTSGDVRIFAEAGGGAATVINGGGGLWRLEPQSNGTWPGTWSQD